MKAAYLGRRVLAWKLPTTMEASSNLVFIAVYFVSTKIAELLSAA